MKHFVLLAAAGLLAFPAYAATSDHSHHGMHSSHRHSVSGKKTAKNAAVKAYRKALEKMHCEMDIAYSGDADIDFASGMVPHHQGAVDMTRVLMAYGKDAQLKELGQRIITWQESEIGIMKRWLAVHGGQAAAVNKDAVAAYKEAMAAMHKNMAIAYSGDADVDFVRGMIPHHQGAIDMAWVLVKYGRDAELREIAHDVIRSQQQEIAFMNNWLKKHAK